MSYEQNGDTDIKMGVQRGGRGRKVLFHDKMGMGMGMTKEKIEKLFAIYRCILPSIYIHLYN
jgi:hypothetical protein